MRKILVPFDAFKANVRVMITPVVVVLGLLASGVPLRPASVVNAQEVTPAGELRELAIETGEGTRCAIGQPNPLKGRQPGFGWVNKLTPASYPATLRAITIGFERTLEITGVKPDSLYRIVAYVDPEGDGPGNNQAPDATFIGRVRGTDLTLMTFNLITPLTIPSGSFVVGAIDEFGIANLPALFFTPGKSTPPGSESFSTVNGGASWQKLSELAADSVCGPGSLMVRATVELGTVDPLAVTRIKDPAAVEPWGIAALPLGFTVVTNYVSDNLTIIKTQDNSFENLPAGDGPGGTPDGPFGVAGAIFVEQFTGGDPLPPQVRAYVTLFGSNTIPTKEFPADYSALGPGRVLVLAQRPDTGALRPLVQINVNKGPMFPAIARVGPGKLYVPCSGADKVDVIDTNRNLKIAEISVGRNPSSCSASLDNSKIYVTNFGAGTISVIDTKTDTKIKDIPAPAIQFPTAVNGPTPAPAIAANPWSGAVSPANGNLYVTYWSTSAGDVMPNGALVEFDTCKDEFIRALIDDATRGASPGSAGSSGIPAPTAPLTRDPATGKTLEAGGGGGGPFGVSACVPNSFADPPDVQHTTVVFTNDALGIAGVIDARIDQVLSAPPIAVASCPKPRGVACRTVGPPGTHFAFVACGQPDNSVLMFRVPQLPENIATIPVIESVDIGDVLRLVGAGFALTGTHIEVSRGAACLTFNKPLKFKKSGRVLIQKGSLSDGTSLTDAVNATATIRLVHSDGTVRVIRR